MGDTTADAEQRTVLDIQAIRRVITGVDPEGRSTVWTDSPSPHLRDAADFIKVLELWSTPSAAPGSGTGADADAGDIPLLLEPEDEHGTIIRIARYDPDPPGVDLNALMHSTRTVDYVLVMSGEISCHFEDGSSVDLRSGDVLIQRGTVHAWSNTSDRPCFMLVVFVAARDHGSSEGGWRPE
jgi:mannose-6-phosphate isomerase-like protein (cupin superfamily)